MSLRESLTETIEEVKIDNSVADFSKLPPRVASPQTKRQSSSHNVHRASSAALLKVGIRQNMKIAFHLYDFSP